MAASAACALGPDGKVLDIVLPFDGTVGACMPSEEDGILISLHGWLTPAGI